MNALIAFVIALVSVVVISAPAPDAADTPGVARVKSSDFRKKAQPAAEPAKPNPRRGTCGCNLDKKIKRPDGRWVHEGCPCGLNCMCDKQEHPPAAKPVSAAPKVLERLPPPILNQPRRVWIRTGRFGRGYWGIVPAASYRQPATTYAAPRRYHSRGC